MRRILEEPAPSPLGSADDVWAMMRDAIGGSAAGPSRSALRRELEGDLEWITAQGAGKRPHPPLRVAAASWRRISNATLGNEPIMARPPSALYRIRKLVRRHRVAVAAAVAGFVLLIAFAVTMAVQNARIATERDRANREAAALRAVSEYLKGLFTVADPGEARGNSITARELLDRSAAGNRAASRGAASRPRPSSWTRSAASIEKLGLYRAGALLCSSARVACVPACSVREHPDTLQSRHHLAVLARERGPVRRSGVLARGRRRRAPAPRAARR